MLIRAHRSATLSSEQRRRRWWWWWWWSSLWWCNAKVWCTQQDPTLFPTFVPSSPGPIKGFPPPVSYSTASHHVSYDLSQVRFIGYEEGGNSGVFLPLPLHDVSLLHIPFPPLLLLLLPQQLPPPLLRTTSSDLSCLCVCIRAFVPLRMYVIRFFASHALARIPTMTTRTYCTIGILIVDMVISPTSARYVNKLDLSFVAAEATARYDELSNEESYAGFRWETTRAYKAQEKEIGMYWYTLLGLSALVAAHIWWSRPRHRIQIYWFLFVVVKPGISSIHDVSSCNGTTSIVWTGTTDFMIFTRCCVVATNELDYTMQGIIYASKINLYKYLEDNVFLLLI